LKCIKLKPLRWLEIILAFTAVTLLVTYLIPSDSPLEIAVFRYIFGFVFVTFLPGYCLVNILFISRNRLDLVEELVLSVALSFGLDGLAGLFLGLSPIGLNFTSITISLSVLVLVLASVSFMRKTRVKPLSITVTSPVQENAKRII
jgi:uncharacterized membrane protein